MATATPTNSHSSRPRRLSMTSIPAVAELISKVLDVENSGSYLLSTLYEGVVLYGRHGPPDPVDFPQAAEYRRRRDEAAQAVFEAAGHGRPEFSPTAWSEFLLNFPARFGGFLAHCRELIDLTESLDLVLDPPDVPTSQRLSPLLVQRVQDAVSHVHPSIYGEDGLGFFRGTEMNVPDRFWQALDQVTQWRRLVEAAKQTPPVDKTEGWTLDSLAEEAQVSVKTMQSICEKASITRPKRGGHSFTFGRKEVRAMIAVCTFPNRPAWCKAKANLTLLLAKHGFAV